MRFFTGKLIRIIMLLGVILSLSINTAQVNANDPIPPSITTIDQNLNSTSNVKGLDIGIARAQKININANAIEQIAHNISSGKNEKQSAKFHVFDDVAFDANFEMMEETIQSGFILSGNLNGNPDSSIILVSTDGVISANLEYQGKQYHLKSDEQGFYQFEEIDQSQFPEELDALPYSDNLSESFSDFIFDTNTLDAGYVIDVMVVYTATARSRAGGTSQMQNLINLAVSETNIGYQRSGIFSTMRLVNTTEINYDESNMSTQTGWNNTLSHLTNQDGVIDDVRNLRDTYGADLVVMIVDSSTYCGVGWLMTPSYTYDTVGNSIVSRACATGYYSFAHETGHNMGAHHDRTTAGGGTAMYNYSYGYQDPNAAFRTIMAYNCSSGCPRINNWSNPEVFYNGRPTGVLSTASNSADNQLTLNNTAPIVSNFRQSATPPKAPTNLAIQQVNPPSATITYFDNSNDELGFKVERSINSGAWSNFQTLPVNTTSFTDTSINCENSFAYRVYSYNQNGNSPYSNVTNFSCAPPLPITDIKIYSSISSITLDWTASFTNTTYTIEIQDELTKSMALDQGLEFSQLPYTINGLEKDTTYFVIISATNEFGTTINDPITVKTAGFQIFLPLTTKN
ncbi:MAG: M12 family metallo-peptidase [Anaerolineaceae bacterium]|nr:M12 family metallo-peptidase [Anaerolineaceae bacterium]